MGASEAYHGFIYNSSNFRISTKIVAGFRSGFYDVVTHGAFTAYGMGYKQGGLVRWGVGDGLPHVQESIWIWNYILTCRPLKPWTIC